jgi:hypothetical protein
MSALNVQATAIPNLVDTGADTAFNFIFAVYVTDQTGAPVTKLPAASFRVMWFENGSMLKIAGVDEMESSPPVFGVYRVRTHTLLAQHAPTPQQLQFLLRVVAPGSKSSGAVPVNALFLGPPK